MAATESSAEKLRRKLFLGGLNYSTDEDGLRNHFGGFGELVDVVVMRFPDTRRSRGFGFVTFAAGEMADACFNAKPHVVDGKEVEIKRAMAKEESAADNERKRSETSRKVFVGGLNYETTDDGLRTYFEQYGTLVDSIVMKFRDTNRSRGFGFVTFADDASVDNCQANRPHTIDGQKVETKRATPKDELGNEGSTQSVKKIFVGGIKDGLENEDLKEYFSQFGTVVNVEHMTEKSTGRKRGFGFVEFDDYDAVDKLIINAKHHIKQFSVDVRKAISKTDLPNKPGGGGGRRDPGGPNAGGPRGGGWGGNQGYGGGGGGFKGNQGGYGGGGFGGGGQGGYGGGQGGYGGGGGGWGGGQGGPAAGSWGAPAANSWDAPPGGNSWGGGAGAGGQWGGAPNPAGGGFDGGYGRGGGGGAAGGPMRSQMGGGARSAPYNVGGRGGMQGGGGYGGGAAPGGAGGGYSTGGAAYQTGGGAAGGGFGGGGGYGGGRGGGQAGGGW